MLALRPPGHRRQPARHRQQLAARRAAGGHRHRPPPAARRRAQAAPWCDVRSELGATSTIVLRVPARPAGPHRLAAGHRAVLRPAHPRPATWAARPPTPSATPTCSWCRWSTTRRCRASRTPRCRASTSRRWTAPCARRGCGATWWPPTWASCPIPTWWPRWPTCCWASTAPSSSCAAAATAPGPSCRCAPTPRESRAGTLMREIIDAEGAAGGHGTMAGGRLHEPAGQRRPAGEAFDRIVAPPADGGGRPEGRGVPLVDR